MKLKLLSVVCVLFILSGCAKPVEEDDGIVDVVATIGPIANVVQVIGGEYVDVQGLMGPGVDPHLYKASESDVRKLANADLIFYNGLNLEAKMGEVLEHMGGDVKTVAVAEGLAKTELLDSVDYPGHYDPHVWFDVILFTGVVERIAQELMAYDPENSEYYLANTTRYVTEKLSGLNMYVYKRVQEVPENSRVLVTAHDAFRYFGKAYGFEVMGLQGISTESKAGIADVQRLAKFIAERQIRAIFVESSVSERNIVAVQEAVQALGWDVELGGELFSDAMGDAGTIEGTYVGMIRHNIDTIVDALK